MKYTDKTGGEQREALKKTILAIALRHNKPYIYASVETMRLFMRKYHNTNVSPRTMGRRIAELRAEGTIIREFRTRPDGNGGKTFNTYLTFITRKLFEWAEKMERFARKVFSFFRRPTLASYSSLNTRRDLEGAKGIVEILWKSPPNRRSKPSEAIL
jgi:hypothetical protein